MSLAQEKSMYIIGAGFAGQMIAEEIKTKKIFGQVAAFIDDDPALIGKEIDGVPVLGPINHFMSFLRHSDYDEAIIAMPSAPTERIREVYNVLSRCGFTRIRILPALSQVIEGNAHLVQAREIDPLDILGRTPVTINLKESLSYLRGKRVLITGAGGSIGSELARQLLSGGAERLYLFGHGENSIYLIDRELRLLQKEGVGEKATIVPVIGDLKDREYMRFILSRLKADVVFHCAAYKHVPLMEENPVAVIDNNVFGTKNLLDAAIEAGVSRFVLISTDKAVAPVGVYGVSKMLCEKLLLSAADTVGAANQTGTALGAGATGTAGTGLAGAGTVNPAGVALADAGAANPAGTSLAGADAVSSVEPVETNKQGSSALGAGTTSQAGTALGADRAFMFVRFGNVLGSRGSVLHVFMNQIKTGGPLTVTDREVNRYFMTIPEACSLVLKTGGVGKNGTPYLLDMGEPVKILDLAEQCIRFSGFEPYRDIQIEVTGLRPGERRDEPLWLAEEAPAPTEYPKIMQLSAPETSPENNLMGEPLKQLLEELDPICHGATSDPRYRNRELLKETLARFVPSYAAFVAETEAGTAGAASTLAPAATVSANCSEVPCTTGGHP